MFQTAVRMWQIGKQSLGWIAPVLVVGVLLGGILLAGRWAREQIRSSDRHAISFSTIDCTVPPGMKRDDFLAEVQYLASSPDRVELLEVGLAAKLAAAFAQHPRVEKVQRVAVLEGGVRVELVFRDRAGSAHP